MTSYSVLMSVYHREKPEHLRQAIQSMIDQTVPPDDFVLVCDGPLTDELDRVITDVCEANPQLFQIHRLKENLGLGNALRIGLELCKNEFVARMDSDDIALPDRMERQIPVLLENAEASVVGGQIAEFAGTPENIVGYREVPLTSEDILNKAAFRNPMNHVTVVFRKSHILEAGSYISLIGFEDYFLWVRVLASGKKMINLNSVCCNVRTDDMYNRRGGLQYFKRTVEMQKHLLRFGLCSRSQFYRNLAIRFAGTMIPTNLRGFLFKKVMRKQSINN